MVKNRIVRIFIGIVVVFLLFNICIESATALDAVDIKGSVFNGSDITNDDMGYVGTSGNGILEMNFSNSDGFYYDSDDDFNFYNGNDKIEIVQNLTTSSRTIEKNGLIYTTAVVDTEYNNTEWADIYQKIWFFGEEYVPIKSNTENKLSKLLIDDSDSHTIRNGQSLELEEGYAIKVEQIDVDGNKVWLNLTKDGNNFDDIVIDTNNFDAMEKTWNFTQNVANETDVETLKIFVDQVFNGQTTSLAVIKGIWQISDTVKTINVNDKVNDFNVSSAGNGSIVFKNNGSLNLTRNSVVAITDILSFNIADSSDIKFRLTKKYNLSRTYKVRGNVMTVDASNNSIPGVPNVSWTFENFQGFVYDMYGDIGYETLIINSTEVAGTALDSENRSIASNSLVYSTTIHSLDYKSSYLMLADTDGYERIGYFGDEYVPIKLGRANKISKLLIDDSESHTIRTGQSFELEEGYAFTPQQIDVNGGKVWIELTKNGSYVADKIINMNTSDHSAKTWGYEQNIGSEFDIITHMIYADQIFQGQSDSFVVIKGIWQISDAVNILMLDDTVGILKGEAIDDTITMKNEQSFELTRSTDINIAGGIKLRVLDDSNIVRCYPFKEVIIEPLIINYNPSSSYISNYVGESRLFNVTIGQVANITWILDGTNLYTNTSVTTASYQNYSAKIGTHNVTVFVENINGTDQKKWTWGVSAAIPSEIVVNISKIRGSIINGSDITNDDMGYIGTTGNGIIEINTSNFAGFYYDHNSNIGTEKFEILQNSTVSSAINKSGLVYTTSIMNADYEQTLWTDQYQKIGYFGEEYVPIKSDLANNLSKLLIDEKDSHTLRTGQSFELGEGYVIIPQQIDVNGDKVWLELTKNGEFVADKVISVKNASDIIAKTWTYDADLGSETDVVQLKVYIDEVFQGQFDSLTIIKGIWQISDSILEFDTNTTVGRMKVQEIDSKIKMTNNESITLSKGSTVDIANNMSIVVADSTNAIRFHFSNEYITPAKYEIRGEVYNLSSSISGIIDYNNFAGFYYDLDTNIGTETLEIDSITGRTINASSLIYTTMPKVAEFEHTSWGSYDIIGFMGLEYFVGYTSSATTFVDSTINMMSNGQLSKILVNDGKSRSLYSGSGLILKEGYVLNIVEVDKNGDKVFVTLTKDGLELYSSIISSNSDYVYKKDLGSSNNVPIIVVHFKDMFQVAETSAVSIDGIFQISDQYIAINTGDLYNLMEVDTISVNKIEMKNENSITLTGDTTITIMDKFKFKVADDSNNVRYYPFTEVIIQPLAIDSFSPNVSSQGSTAGGSQEFEITTNKICNITWMINNVVIQTNVSTVSASYANDTAPAGLYNVTAVAENSIGISQKTWNWTVTNPTVTPPSSSGGGSGGGSGNSGEEYENIEVKDVVREQIVIDTDVTYEFKEETNAIDTIVFTALKNSGEISATIEVLKERSALVKNDPPGKVYQNMNIWVGKSGFATSNNIKDVKVGFKVEKSWIKENDIVVSTIRLCRNHDDVWNPLPTKQSGEDDTYIYFEAKTPGFSPFSITGSTEEEVVAQGFAGGSELSGVPDGVDAQSQSEGADIGDDGGEGQDDEGVSTVWYVVGALMVMIVGGGAYWMYGMKKDEGREVL